MSRNSRGVFLRMFAYGNAGLYMVNDETESEVSIVDGK
jgi:hypothetical protein